jgi:hypothetical protein
LAKPAHILTRSATARRIINMTAIAAVDAQEYALPPLSDLVLKRFLLRSDENQNVKPLPPPFAVTRKRWMP